MLNLKKLMPLALTIPLGTPAASQPSTSHVQTVDWEELGELVGGRLRQVVPFAQPCYDQFNSSECLTIREGYVNDVIRTSQPPSFIQPNWETCQRTGSQCQLDSSNPHNQDAVSGRTCESGGLAQYYIEVQNADDVKAAFAFAKNNKVPISIKNTGHDYAGRSSAPGSLQLWMHKLQNISYNPSFIPEGCPGSSAQPGVTTGAGVRYGDASTFAEAHNITLITGGDGNVGAVGGWLQGGGHGALSNTMGMGVDRVLQYKVVTPDGKFRITNECQNQDLFWALRGGGGGTFGVVLEATLLASPAIKVQSFVLAWPAGNVSRTRRGWEIFTENTLRLAEEGWGGYSMSNVFVLVNPKLSPEEAEASLAPLIQWSQELVAEEGEAGAGNIRVVRKEYDGWPAFMKFFTVAFKASIGRNLALSSRLIPKSNVQTQEDRAALVDAMVAANTATPGLIVLFTTPFSVPDAQKKTSVNPAWRNSVYHITVISPWGWNATVEDVKNGFRKVTASTDHLRRITPNAAYPNEADVFEPDWQNTFWGENYSRLLDIKRKYDPHRLLNCWHCVGFQPDLPNYSCYPDL